MQADHNPQVMSKDDEFGISTEVDVPNTKHRINAINVNQVVTLSVAIEACKPLKYMPIVKTKPITVVIAYDKY